MRVTFAVGKSNGGATELLVVGAHGPAGDRRDGGPSFARSTAGAGPFPGPWTLKALIRSPKLAVKRGSRYPR